MKIDEFISNWEEFNTLVIEYRNVEPTALAFQLGNMAVPNASHIVSQVKNLKKAESKLPSWAQANCYLPTRAFEQASSEAASKIRFCESGALALDLTCGLGVDSAALAKRFDRVISLEPDPDLAAIVRHNFKLLGIENVEVLNQSAENFTANGVPDDVEFVFADPDRRTEGKREILFQNLSPNLVNLVPKLLEGKVEILIKTSPLFDLAEGPRIFDHVDYSYVLSIKNEVKEAGFKISKQPKSNGGIRILIAGDEPKEFRFSTSDAGVGIGSTNSLKYIHEPDVAFYKSNLIPQYLASNETDFQGVINSPRGYGFSDSISEDFCGKIFHVREKWDYRPKAIRKKLKDLGIARINITKKDFRESVANIRKQIGAEEGGEFFLICCTEAENGPVCLFSEAIRL